MIRLASLSLFLGWKCNLSCSHCGFSCGPERVEKMPFDEAVKYIEAAARNPDLEMIAFSGGEPFLYLQEVRELMGYAFKKGLRGGIVTNGFWAKDYEETRQIIAQLKKIGLQEIITSFDDYHQAAIEAQSTAAEARRISMERHHAAVEMRNVVTGAQNIANIIKAAEELHLYCGVNMLVTKKSSIRKANAAELLGLDLEGLIKAKKMWIRESSPLSVGRAWDSCASEEIINYGEKELLDNPCPFIVQHSVITPEGSLYACCGFGDADRQGPSALMLGGNLKEDSFERSFQNISNNLMYNIISQFGPYRLRKIALDTYPGITVKERYISNCEVCDEIAKNRELRQAVVSVLSKMASAATRLEGGIKYAHTGTGQGES